MFTKEIEGEAYAVDPKKLKDIQFPFFLPYAKNAFYTESNRLVYLPIQFTFVNAKDKSADLRARLLLPKNYTKIEAKATMPMEYIVDALYHAFHDDISIIENPYIKAYMKKLADVLYKTLILNGDSFIMTDTEYAYPSFIVKDREIIGVSDKTIFRSEGKDLHITMQNTHGTYLSSFYEEKDNDLFAVILDYNGEKIISARIHIESAKQDEMNASITRIYKGIEPFVSTCQKVYESYHEDYLNYFLDKEEPGEEDDFGLFE